MAVGVAMNPVSSALFAGLAQATGVPRPEPHPPKFRGRGRLNITFDLMSAMTGVPSGVPPKEVLLFDVLRGQSAVGGTAAIGPAIGDVAGVWWALQS